MGRPSVELHRDAFEYCHLISDELHLLYFLFSCVAYAMWKLVDFQVKRDMGVELDADPEVEFGDFLKTMRDYLFRGG